MSDSGEAIRPGELDRLFACLFADSPDKSDKGYALAVSGGSDSTALMVLVAEWLRLAGQSFDAFAVLTVDHRLRPESTSEAGIVARQAIALGFRHATLVWDGDKPRTGLQAAARAARYRLMADYARAHGVGLIATAHTQDDQAETLLMRLARGSGLDGLSAMAATAPLQDGESLLIGRPLLDVSKARLQASLRARGIGWIEDPSNASPVFERVRLRAGKPALEGLGLTPRMLGLSARRLQRVRTALDRWVADVLDPAAGIVEVHPCGFFRVDRNRLRALPDEIVARVLDRLIAAAGGAGETVPLSSLEAILLEVASAQSTGAWTLARARVGATPERVLIEREPGRDALPVLALASDESVLWDGRFRVAAAARLGAGVEVRALGVDGLRDLRARVDIPAGLPVAALRAVPSFWHGDNLLAVPPLGFWSDAEARSHLAAVFEWR
jgi:tRNA(Ile)-lysidine synthase